MPALISRSSSYSFDDWNVDSDWGSGIEARIDYRPGGIAAVGAAGDLPQVAELAESLLEEGFFGFVIELERAELAAAFDDLESEGLVGFVNAQTFGEHSADAER